MAEGLTPGDPWMLQPERESNEGSGQLQEVCIECAEAVAQLLSHGLGLPWRGLLCQQTCASRPVSALASDPWF